ncbi:MAG: RraA family protein [Planctomycetes bacterium]|nr:RraA family protein [Planctomycetota bacterium]
MLTREQLEEIRRFDGPTICNALECFGLRPKTAGFALPGLRPRTLVDHRMIGYAATARVSAAHPGGPTAPEALMAYYQHLRDSPKPSIAVIQDVDPQPVGSFWGEVQATVHCALGAVGTLTLGGVRDMDEVEQLGFHFFSTHVLISHANIHVLDSNVGVDILGVRINPADLVFADKHGVVVIPKQAAPRLAQACQAIAEAEMPMLRPCREAIRTGAMPTIDQLRQWRADMARARSEVSKITE